MPAAHWETFRLGARLPALDCLLSDDADSDVVRSMEGDLSAVAVIRPDVIGGTGKTGQVWRHDDWLVGRIALGLLARGWPTLSSPNVERTILESLLGHDGIRVDLGEFGGQGNSPLDCRLIPQDAEANWPSILSTALLAGDDRLIQTSAAGDAEWDDAEIPWYRLWDSYSERRFFREVLEPLFGGCVGSLEPQRPLSTMMNDEKTPKKPFWGRADFVFEAEGDGSVARMIIELDGPHHRETSQRASDRARDQALEEGGWPRPTRVRVEALGNPQHPDMVRLRDQVDRMFAEHPSLQRRRSQTAVALDEVSLALARRLLLTPHAAARVQLGVVLTLIEGGLSLSQEAWDIVVVEREVACAEVALLDLCDILRHLCDLYDVPIGLNRIRIRIVEGGATGQAPLSAAAFSAEARAMVHVEAFQLQQAPDERPDLLLDVSVSARPTQRFRRDPARDMALTGRSHIVLRTAHRLSGNKELDWPAPRVVAEPRQKADALDYFLRTLFRKPGFRPGQMGIIERALQRKSVIGLLPTGAGKSLTYQLPALLSPGLTIVVDPIKSLMQDQVDNLASLGIHDAATINSDKTSQEKSAALQDLVRGRNRFLFIAPERLQMEKFRQALASVRESRPTAFVVVDEAHCVSEWGHDFRTAYLNLGKHAREFCQHAGAAPPLVALTGTASRTVLTDVQRELAIDDPTAIVSLDNFDRPELRFQLRKIPSGAKGAALRRWLLEELPSQLTPSLGLTADELFNGSQGGIVFCPFVNREFGTYHVHQQIRNMLSGSDRKSASGLVSHYSGSVPKMLQEEGTTEESFAQHKLTVQRRFKRDQLAILVATKAFGMGIDKPNIRYTIHYGMAESPEAFAQEAGRAGRDRQHASCLVLFSDAKGDLPDDADPLQPGISAAQARRRYEDLKGKTDDDADRVLFLHTDGYPGVEFEAACVREFYLGWVRPELKKVSQTTKDTTFPLSSSDVHVCLWKRLPKAVVEEFDAKKAKNSKAKRPEIEIERMVYRLAILGLVTDYTIEYPGHGGKQFLISARRLNDAEIEGTLLRYVSRYRAGALVDAVRQRLDAPGLTDEADFVSRAIETLCWFIYEEIEKQRRAAIATMRDMLRSSLQTEDPGQELGRRLADYLSNSTFTKSVSDLIGKHDARVAPIAADIRNTDEARQLLGQCQRYLPDDPENPGFFSLIGAAHAMSGSVAEAARNIRIGLDLAARERGAASAVASGEDLARLLLEHPLARGREVVEELACRQRHDVFARAAFVAAPDPELKRDCVWPFVASIAAMTADLVASHLEA